MSNHFLKEAIKRTTPAATHALLRKLQASVRQPFAESMFFLNYHFYHRRYNYPLIYIAACPKTASTWLSNLLAELLPGFSLYHPRLHVEGQNQTNYDVTADVVAEMRNKLLTIRSHTPASQENIDMLDREFGRYLSLTRDLRDVIVSVYYHIRIKPMSAFVDHGLKRKLPWDPVSQRILELDKNECLDVLIEKLLPDLVKFSKAWHDSSRKKENVHLIRFEDLIAETQHELEKILHFFDISKPGHQIKSTIERMGKSSKTQKRHNFRRGKIDGWKEELSLAQQKRCEQIAGRHLSDMGYELYHN